MKILAISGSHRKGGNTKILLEEALQLCEKEGVETELIELAGMDIKYCAGHDSSFCREKGCIYDDGVEEILKKMEEADAIIIGSPVYLATISSKLKSFMDRTVRLRRKDFALSKKVGAAVAVGAVQGGGQEYTLSSIHNYMLGQDMTVVSDGIDTAHFGVVAIAKDPGDVKDDEHGMMLARNLGKRVVKELKLRD
jgi:multimeric flavodoxin WrbA